MNDQCQEAQRAIKTNFSRAIIDIQEEIKSRIKDALADCETDVRQALAAAREALDSGEAARQRDRAVIEENLAEIRSLKAGAVKLLGTLGAGPLAAAPVEPRLWSPRHLAPGPASVGPASVGQPSAGRSFPGQLPQSRP